jgi:hypothetical protein
VIGAAARVLGGVFEHLVGGVQKLIKADGHQRIYDAAPYQHLLRYVAILRLQGHLAGVQPGGFVGDVLV